MGLRSDTARVIALGMFAAVCGAGGAVAAITGVPQVRDALRGPQGSQGPIGRAGLNGPPSASVDPAKLKRDVLSDLNMSSCYELGTRVSVVTGVAVSPFDTFGRPALDVSQQSICVLQ